MCFGIRGCESCEDRVAGNANFNAQSEILTEVITLKIM